ncbi:MAG: magnesium chelatase, partial [Bryobacteraceae bacterium]
RTHYPATLDDGMEITSQEAWTRRGGAIETTVPPYVRETAEQLAFLAREDKKVDKRSGVSQRLPISVLENVVSNAERRALAAGEALAVPRIADLYAALPSITGKIELEYEGELKGGDQVARELIRLAVGRVYNRYYDGVNMSSVIQWFDLGGTLKLDDTAGSETMLRQLESIQGLMEKTAALGLGASEPDAVRVSAAEFVLEGLYAHRRISRSEEHGFGAEEKKPAGSKDDGPRPNLRRPQYN